MGNSAGGTLCISTLLALRDAGEPCPGAALLISPWVDPLAATGSILTNEPFDVGDREFLVRCIETYMSGRTPNRPSVTPVYADLRGLPPLFIQVGAVEILLDVESHPNSEAAQFSGRLAYLAAAIACASLDLISMEAAFRTLEEKYELLVNAIRYGATDRNEGLRNVNLALELIRQYSPAANVSNAVDSAVHKDLDRIPAEIIAEQSSRIIQTSDLFEVGRQLEHACYSRAAPNFDALETDARSFVGAALDFASVRRAEFASSWLTDQSSSPHADVLSDVGSQDSLFKKS